MRVLMTGGGTAGHINPALAIAEKIRVSDEDVVAKIAELRDVYKKSPDALKQLKDPNVKNDIRNRLVMEATLDYLVEVNS